MGAMNFFAGPPSTSSSGGRSATASTGRRIVHREPIGVVGAIVAWNVPLFLAVNKLGPALLAGCTVVLKPAAETPLTAIALAEVFAEAGLPEGVLSVVPGGTETGQALTVQPRRRPVHLHRQLGRRQGDRQARRRDAQAVHAGARREIGGHRPRGCRPGLRAPDDGVLRDHEHRAGLCGPDPHPGAALALRRNRGRGKRFRAGAAGRAAVDPAAQIGSLITEKQRARVEGYIAKGIEEGARLVCGGGRPEGLDSGFFVQPTVFADVDNKMTIAQEEIFGPVLAIIPYDTEDDAIKIANDSVYGLAGSVWTTDIAKGIEDLGEDPHRDLRDQLVRLRSRAARSAATRTPASAARTGPRVSSTSPSRRAC